MDTVIAVVNITRHVGDMFCKYPPACLCVCCHVNVVCICLSAECGSMSTAWASTGTTSLRSTTATAVSLASSTSSAPSNYRGSGGPCFVSVCIAPPSHIFLISSRSSGFLLGRIYPCSKVHPNDVKSRN